MATEDKLPTSGQTTGDVYDIAAASYGAAGMNVAWNGKAWDALGEKFQYRREHMDGYKSYIRNGD